MANDIELTHSDQKDKPAYEDKLKDSLKNKRGIFDQEESLPQENLDPKCLYRFDNTLVCIEYPGQVKNVDKAIESLGGIFEIQKALEGKRLELLFHPRSQFMKGCFSDAHQGLGILVKVIEYKNNKELSYEVIGASDVFFKFNKMCDFQYLPLVAKENPENKESDVKYLYNKIIPEKLPNLEWFTKQEPDNTSPFLLSGNFARFDVPQNRFQLNSAEVFNSLVRKDAPQLTDFGKPKIKQKHSVSSIRITLTKDMEVPTEPPPGAFENVKSKFLQHQFKTIKQLFEERPIWTKPGIMSTAKVNHDSAKQVLPCVAYYCHGGPWRSCWIKFGYNPVTDYNSRIYQILDFRIRQAEGMQIKVKPKRTATNNLAKYFLTSKLNCMGDQSYIIKPNQVPPARQMFYQYSDILLPEVQEMLLKLPKLPLTAKFDDKNGWLPLSFQEHCREIVNRYVFDAVQQELINDAKKEKSAEKSSDVATYCSRMLSNIKMGFSQSIGEYSGAHASDETIIEEIDLSDSEEIDANEVMSSLPERLPENLDEEEEESDLDLEIDMEAVEEVNQIVAGLKD